MVVPEAVKRYFVRDAKLAKAERMWHGFIESESGPTLTLMWINALD